MVLIVVVLLIVAVLHDNCDGWLLSWRLNGSRLVFEGGDDIATRAGASLTISLGIFFSKIERKRIPNIEIGLC